MSCGFTVQPTISYEPAKGPAKVFCVASDAFLAHRWINETLYKSVSQKAVEMMHEDPGMFQEVRLPFSHLWKQ